MNFKDCIFIAFLVSLDQFLSIGIRDKYRGDIDQVSVTIIGHHNTGRQSFDIIINDNEISPTFLSIENLLGKLAVPSLDEDKLPYILRLQTGKRLSFLKVTELSILGNNYLTDYRPSVQDVPKIS